MKAAILKKLTSSKNERLAFELIWDLTRGKNKGYSVIKDADFADGGLIHRNRRNEAVLRLISKGLVFRREEDCYWRGGEGRIFGYSVRNVGCVRFLNGCFKCRAMVGLN